MAASQLHRHHQFALPPCPLHPFHTFPEPASCSFRPTKPWRGLSLCSARETMYSHGSRTESVAVSSSDASAQQGEENLDISTTSTVKQSWDNDAIANAQEAYGEVNKILASRAIDHRMFYLIEWKDGHEPSWLPASGIAKDVVAEYETAWWKAVRAVDDAQLRELLSEEGRDVDAVDENGRTALLFASGLGSEKCVRLLVEAGADVDGQDPDGLTPLHMATGYVRKNTVSALIELGADPEVPDSKGRTPITLAQELIDRVPKANPLQFARRLALENILKFLENEVFETIEVEQVLDKRRSAEDGSIQYLVKWKDGAPDEWVSADSVADDLIKDYEAGLEYGIAEAVVSKREENGRIEYLVRWADAEEATWEPSDNVDAELIAEYENLSVAEVGQKGPEQV